MAGTVVVTETMSHDGKLHKVVFDWTSDTGDDVGKADAETTYQYYVGRIIGATTIPDGTSAPADNYDIRILDDDGHDVCLGALMNRDTANTEHAVEGNMSCVLESKLTLEVTAAHAESAAKGKVILWVSRL
jgi:hypothetical protein